MRKIIVYLSLVCSVPWLALEADAQQAAAETPPAPPPLIGTLASHPDWPAARNPSDVDTVDHLVNSLYDVISGAAGKPRDWERFRSLFLPDGRIGVVRTANADAKDARAPKVDAFLLTPEMYVKRDDPYFRAHGFFERSIANRVEVFGNLVAVWSTYESRHNEGDGQPFARGINSIQIVRAHDRFWIASVLFDEERPGLKLPDTYLK
jgi:hypothetical protein